MAPPLDLVEFHRPEGREVRRAAPQRIPLLISTATRLAEPGTDLNDATDVEIAATAVGAGLPVARRAVGPIRVSGGELLLVSYEMLTMVAQFEDETFDADKLSFGIELPDGRKSWAAAQSASCDSSASGRTVRCASNSLRTGVRSPRVRP